MQKETRLTFYLLAHLDTARSRKQVKFQSENDADTIFDLLMWLHYLLPDSLKIALEKYQAEMVHS